ncbi:MAG: 2-amino-4-hydroxy-6-hydroxymethyldihydropteridine pyrophosphokinae [Bacteroidetes bacterium]|jgi:2-amino-4-hydroxy-6-hydroxymethyldihydropteridine diphosphokinase|nr:2-amino-4-hydroxy-6-hydroxymethyldihydropteridine pyrophosphokinae [Bacteroidota bacterium]
MNRVYLCLGGNLGNREANLAKACVEIEKRIGKLTQHSSLYETASWGKEDQPDYLNQALEVSTDLDPLQLLGQCMRIEQELGRTRDVKWESRLLDIDILFYGSQIVELQELKIPHPFMQERLFVLEPLHEIAAEFVHPVFKKTIAALLTECQDKLKVIRRIG